MNTTIESIIQIFSLQTRLFLNVLEGVTDEHAKQRLGSNTNHIAWIAGHIVSTRYQLGYVLGLPLREPFPEFFERGKGLDNSISYPHINDLKRGWNEISEMLIDKLKTFEESDLLAEAPIPVPTNRQDMLGFISFFAHHEAYHIGQIGISRRIMDYPPMRYN